MGEPLPQSAAHEHVFHKSVALDGKADHVAGYDFNHDIDHAALLRSMLFTGFQASQLGRAVHVVNQMDVNWTPSKVIAKLGKELNHPDSVYYWAYKNNIPIYCPAITDGCIGDNLFFHSLVNPGLRIDLVEDVRRMDFEAINADPRKTGIIILGGGLAKHHICNANMMRNGADFAVYINTAQEFDGSDSGAKPDEAISWGKIKPDATPVKVYCDATIAFPLLVAQTFAPRVKSPKSKSARENGTINTQANGNGIMKLTATHLQRLD